MRYIASVHAYDCLDQVVGSAKVRRYPDYQEGSSDLVLDVHVAIPSMGSDDPARWLQAILEAISKTYEAG